MTRHLNSFFAKQLYCFLARLYLYIYSFISLQVYALEYKSLANIGATIYAYSGCYVPGSPGAGTAQSRDYVFEAIQKLCITRCED